MREYRQFQRIRARQDRVRRAVVLALAIVVAGALALVLRGAAHGQTVVQPVCYISAPVLPRSQPMICLQPRVFVPLVTNTR